MDDFRFLEFPVVAGGGNAAGKESGLAKGCTFEDSAEMNCGGGGGAEAGVGFRLRFAAGDDDMTAQVHG